MPDFNPEHIWSARQTCWTSSPTTSIITLQHKRSKTSPTPIGRTPGHLSNAINFLAFRARISSHRMMLLAILLVKAATASLNSSLGFPNLRSSSFHCCESTPLNPAEPDKVLATLATCSAVTSISIITGSWSQSIKPWDLLQLVKDVWILRLLSLFDHIQHHQMALIPPFRTSFGDESCSCTNFTKQY